MCKSNARGHGTQTFTVAGSALRGRANLQYIAFMNFQEQIKFTLKKLEHCTATNVHIPNERAIQAVWFGCTYSCTTNRYISSVSKRK